MKKTICVEMCEFWWDAVLMAVNDSLKDMKIDDCASFDVWRELNKAKVRIEKTLDRALK